MLFIFLFVLALIMWITVSTVVGYRRKIGAAVSGTYIRSTCCGDTTTPMGWTADGWVSTCDGCGCWQYLGDDHANPPPGFQPDGRPERYFSGSTPTGSVGDRVSERYANIAPQAGAEVTSDELSPAMLSPPNMGGEGHPDYKGPHYDVAHDRFVPYDMLRDPEPGIAVHKVGDVAFAGPLPAEGNEDAEDDKRSD